MIGEVLGNRYELIENIGEGGMAIVYKARDKKLNRLVAVKVLKKEFADNVEIAEKFKREATAIANLSDTNIVNVLDVGHEEDSNTEYFVMEYVDGKTLKDLIVFQGKLAYITAINIAIQIAKALDCAHRNNIIHRDIKPQNILVTENGDVKVTDFGIAKSTTTATITNTTTIMGSAHYLSPEQAKGSFVDARTDIYSLGIVIYEMVTGRLPFDGESPVTIALKHIQEEPVPPKQITSSIPDSLNALILKAISKEPVNRYSSSREMMIDLQKIKDNPDVIIAGKTNLDDSRTIVMSPITEEQVANSKTGKINVQEADGKVNQSNDSLNKKQQPINEDNELAEDDDYEEDDYEEDDDLDYKEPRRSNKAKGNKSKIIVTAIVMVLLIAIGVPASMMLLGGEKDVVVPDLAGKSQSEATSILNDLKLNLQVEKKENSDTVEEGKIISSNPAANTTVKTNSTVYVTISAGVEKVTVPDLREVSLDTATTKLANLNLDCTYTEEYSDLVDEGLVIRQSPDKNSVVPKGSTVQVVISIGPEIKYSSVPNLVSLTEEKAKKALENVQLQLGNVSESITDNKKEDGIVLSQGYEAGTSLQEGSVVDIVIGKYEEPAIDVNQYLHRGMILSDAVSALSNAGISYSIAGGNPSPKEYELYKVTSFTTEIKSGEKVQIEIEQIPSTPVNHDNSVSNSNNNNNNNDNNSNNTDNNNSNNTDNNNSNNTDNNNNNTDNNSNNSDNNTNKPSENSDKEEEKPQNP